MCDWHGGCIEPRVNAPLGTSSAVGLGFFLLCEAVCPTSRAHSYPSGVFLSFPLRRIYYSYTSATKELATLVNERQLT